MRNAEIADAFAELADRLALTDLKPYRYMAYRKAATVFRELGESAVVLSEEGRLTEIDGIGPAIEEKVRGLLAEGTFPALERAREDVPDALLALTRLPGVGSATAKKIYVATDGESFDSLVERAAAGTLTVGDGMTKKVIEALADVAQQRATGGTGEARGVYSGVPVDERGVPLPGPWIRRDQAQALQETLIQLLPAQVQRATASGDFVRGCELLRDVVVIAESTDPTSAVAASCDALGARGWEIAGRDEVEALKGIDAAATAQLVSPTGIPATLAISEPEHATRLMHRMAGPSAWVSHEPEPIDESVPIELRDRILAGTLRTEDVPRDLVHSTDLRGELHAHSDWSDGRAPIIDMARAARDRGDEYFCVTDHSAPYAMVGGLDPDRLRSQAEEIARVNEQLAREHEEDAAPAFRVLRGTELEILADGTLGLPDSALRQLDWVVASIHVQQRQSADVILERMRRVLDNPLVDAIGHPTSRRLLVRDRTALDVEQLIDLAAANEVVLEINANPDRLDLDSQHAAQAIAAGVRLTINTDAHRTSTLALRDHGVAVARRAGVRVDDVVNCLPADRLRASRRRDR